jgi:two-component system response regulator DevR
VTPISVLVVDDHEVVRVGLGTLLGRRKDITVVGTASSADEALRMAQQHRPDVVVCDVRMPGRSGIEACRDLQSRVAGVRVLMLTSYADEDAVLASILAGASGYLLKDTTGKDLIDAIHQVAGGASLLDPAVTGIVLSRLKAEQSVGSDAVSARERQILQLISEGKTNREIGAALFLAEGTVRNLVSQILAKIGAGSRTEAAARFARSSRPVEGEDGLGRRDEGP